MIKKIVLTMILTGVLFSAETKNKVIDMGIHGHLYDIEEEDMMKQIKNSINEKEVENRAKKMLMSEMKKQLTAKPNLEHVKEINEYTIDNYVILERDIKSMNGTLLYKAGDKYYIKDNKVIDLCFVDGFNKISLNNQIEYFDKLVKKKGSKSLGCVYFVANTNVKKLSEERNFRDFYPLKKLYADKFMVKSIPTYIHIEKGKRHIMEFPIDMFKHEVK